MNALYTLTSALHSEVADEVLKEPFIAGIEHALGKQFTYFGDDFSTYGTHDTDIIYIRTGGTEGLFKRLGLTGDIKLLTSGRSNSLAASMEILAYLRSRGQSGEILHGSPASLAARIAETTVGLAEHFTRSRDELSRSVDFVMPMPEIDLKGIRLGVIGRPSDWLIASEVDYQQVKARLNADLIDIPIDELIAETTVGLAEHFPRSKDELSRSVKERMKTIEGSEAIYEALKRICRKYRLGGLTIRCFDLLDTLHNTGCLALARLNAEGIPSSCEGDIPALLTMAWLQQTKGRTGFQCNLSRIEGDRLLFAHCTVPLNMVRSYRYDTHFESGIGTAIKGEFEERGISIYKFAPDLRTMVIIPGKIIKNLSEKSLCRTQILVEAPGAAEYMLRHPLANHHVLA